MQFVNFLKNTAMMGGLLFIGASNPNQRCFRAPRVEGSRMNENKG
jgi:hypothetical protein